MRMMVAICCMCEKVRDDVAAQARQDEVWVELGTYLDDHECRPADLLLSHSYCPGCLDLCQEIWKLKHEKPRDLTSVQAQ